MRLLHVITGLSTGGAETALASLVAATAGEVAHEVVALGPGGPLVDAVGTIARVEVLGAASVGALPRALAHVRRRVAETRPDIVQGWMYHGNVVATLAARGRPALWSIRQCLTSLSDERPGTRLAILAGVPLSRRAAHIVYNSAASAAQHQRLGYAAAHGLVIPNGFDVARFRPDPKARCRIRGELGIPPDAVVVAHVARAHPVKDHASFVAALAPALARHRALHVLMAGAGVNRTHAPIAPLLAEGIATRVHLLGERGDVPALLAGSDVLCLTSRAEAFPNVVGEAMATGLVVVATDVGDVRALLGADGTLVRPGDPAALLEALERILRMAPAMREDVGRRLRARIEDGFGLAAMARAWLTLWHGAARRERAA